MIISHNHLIFSDVDDYEAYCHGGQLDKDDNEAICLVGKGQSVAQLARTVKRAWSTMAIVSQLPFNTTQLVPFNLNFPNSGLSWSKSCWSWFHMISAPACLALCLSLSLYLHVWLYVLPAYLVYTPHAAKIARAAPDRHSPWNIFIFKAILKWIRLFSVLSWSSF